MISVPAHDVDLARIRELLPDQDLVLEDLEKDRPVEVRVEQLASSANRARGGLDLFVRGNPDWPRLVHWIRFVARARTALFTFACRPERDRWSLFGGEHRLVGNVRPSDLDGASWCSAFWLAFAVRDAESLALLTQYPARQISEGEAFERPMVQALQSLFARATDTGANLVKALELADPANVTRTHPDAILYLIAPIFECLVPIADRDAARFQSALEKLLRLRREYYSKSPHDGTNGDENLSEAAAGLVAWARASGFDVDVECPYVPRQLIDLHAP